MSNLVESESVEQSKDGLGGWHELRQFADQLELELHLASMDARDRWRTIKPRLARVEIALRGSSARVSKAVVKEIAAIRVLLTELREDVEDGYRRR